MYFCRHGGFSILQNELSCIDTDETNFYYYHHPDQPVIDRHYRYPGVLDKEYGTAEAGTGETNGSGCNTKSG